MIPNRSMSYRLIAACIISTAQQAKPKVSGHNEPERAHAIIEVNFDDTHSSFIKDYPFARKTRRTCLLKPSGRRVP